MKAIYVAATLDIEVAFKQSPYFQVSSHGIEVSVTKFEQHPGLKDSALDSSNSGGPKWGIGHLIQKSSGPGKKKSV